jgi:exodeoxyribonuclease V alpha subunit
VKAVYVEYPDGPGIREVCYTEDQAKEFLELAYAITVHKSQGSEWRHVIIAVGVGIPTLMKRNLLYTAETRAKKGCTLIAPRKLVYQMVNTPDTDQRLTTLKERIIGYAKKKLQSTSAGQPQLNWWDKLKQVIGL